MSSCRRIGGVLPATALMVAVAAVSVATGQLVDTRGQSVVSGSARREVYRTTYRRQEPVVRPGRDQLRPEHIDIKIEKQEQTRTYTVYT